MVINELDIETFEKIAQHVLKLKTQEQVVTYVTDELKKRGVTNV